MVRFWVMVFLVLCAAAGLSCWALGPVLPARWLARGRALLLGLDALSVALFFAALRWPGLLSETWQRAGLMALSIFWMAQLVLSALVAAAAFARGLYRFACALGESGSLLARVQGFFLGDGAPPDPERRRLLLGAAAYPAAAAAAGLYGGLAEPKRAVVREIDVPVAGLDDALAGFRIAQLSDIHLGLFFSLEDWRALLERAAGTGADALAVTGDLFDDEEMNAEAAAVLDGFCARFPKGVWFCYGNHEYFRDIRATEAALAKTRVHVLRDANARVLDGAPPLYFAGVDYPRARSVFEVDGAASMKAAMRGVPAEAVTVLLAHHPDFFDAAADFGVALALAGHTHGGQLGLFGVPLVPPVFRYMRGLYRVGPTLGYVHSGNGSWFPFRLGCPPEIAVFSLRRA